MVHMLNIYSLTIKHRDLIIYVASVKTKVFQKNKNHLCSSYDKTGDILKQVIMTS